MASTNDADLLKVDYETFQSAAHQLIGLHDAMAQLNADLLNRAQAAAGAGGSLWTGRASQTFASRLNEAAQLTQSILNQLQAAGNSIPTIISTIQDADSLGSGLFATGE